MNITQQCLKFCHYVQLEAPDTYSNLNYLKQSSLFHNCMNQHSYQRPKLDVFSPVMQCFVMIFFAVNSAFYLALISCAMQL